MIELGKSFGGLPVLSLHDGIQGGLWRAAAEVEAPLVEWAPKTVASMPAVTKVPLIQQETVSTDTGLCGLQ